MTAPPTDLWGDIFMMECQCWALSFRLARDGGAWARFGHIDASVCVSAILAARSDRRHNHVFAPGFFRSSAHGSLVTYLPSQLKQGKSQGRGGLRPTGSHARPVYLAELTNE